MNIEKKSIFEHVVSSKRDDVIKWLHSKYQDVREEDCEDIVQDSSIVLWNRVNGAKGMDVADIVRQWKVISRNNLTHWLRHQKFTDEWDDSRLQNGWEERDFGWDQGNWEKMMKREALYHSIEILEEKDRKLIEMVLVKKSMNEISHALGYASCQVAKNRKSRIMSQMKKKCNYFFLNTSQGILLLDSLQARESAVMPMS